METTGKAQNHLPERFTHVTLLGAGNMGEVFRAEDTKLGRLVAVKVLSQYVLEEPKILARFRREARAQAQIDHPHVVKIYEAQLTPPLPFLVMEYVEGTDLEAVLKQTPVLPPSQILRLAEEVGGALDQLHSKGILHRDMKPANLMIRSADGSAVVMDLGLAAVRNATMLTQTGSILGTPLYLAPEVIAGKGWSPAADQYQLAMILFEAASGLRPIQAASISDLMSSIVNGIHSSWPANSKVPENIRNSLGRGISRAPQKRFRNCLELAASMKGTLAPSTAPSISQSGLQGPSFSFSSSAWEYSKSIALHPWKRLALPVALFLVGLFLYFQVISTPPKMIRYQVTGNVLQVRYQGGERSKVRLQVGDKFLAPAPQDSKNYHTITFSGLSQKKETRVHLTWTGGEDAWTNLSAEPPAILGPPHLGIHRQLLLHVLRPIQLGWAISEEPPSMRAFLPGRHLIPLPSEDPLQGWNLKWQEKGISFTKNWKPIEAMESEIHRILALTSGLRPVALQLQRIRGRRRDRGPDPMPGVRTQITFLSSWIATLLSLQTSLPPRRQLLKFWHEWELSAYQGNYLGDQVTIPKASKPGAGYRFWRDPDWEPKGVDPPLKPSAGYSHTSERIHFTTSAGKLLSAEKYLRSTPSIHFAWPQHPRHSETLLTLSIQISGLDSEGLLEIRPAHPHPKGEPPFQLLLWGPHLSSGRGADYYGWLNVSLPADLAPTTGTPCVLRLRSALEASTVLSSLHTLRVTWKSP
jgi:serine/threonine-protein kinase